MVSRCDCGAVTEVREDCLKSGNTRSCGCLQPDVAHSLATHGMWKTRTYRIWNGMKARCRNKDSKKAHLYAGKGIKVCDRWLSFENFLADMGEAPDGMSIERRNGNGNYEPGNCMWATLKDQANNTTRNRLVTHVGRTQTVAQWAAEIGVDPNTLLYRLRRGWTIEQALSPTQRNTLRKQKRSEERAQRRRACETCGAEFFPRKWQLDQGRGRFCSQKCNMAGRAAMSAPDAQRRARETRNARYADSPPNERGER